MHLNNKNSKFLFNFLKKKKIFLMQVNPYAEWSTKISPQILCGMSQLGPLFVGQVGGRPMRGGQARIAIPTL